MQNLSKFLEFNGKRIALLLKDGTWWIAIRPICEALNVDYNRQYQNIQNDEILGRVFANQQTHDAINRLQEMGCLPEKFIYGWLFSIRSNSEELKKYKLKCYEVLYDYFHGSMTGRITALSERDEVADKIAALEEKLMDLKEYQEIQKLRKQQKSIGKTLVLLDNELRQKQLRLDL